ncbi:hypothetical protein ABS755_07255 [Castellaniella sp. FW104-16D08]|uniref:hypothetical protein n=1 Tax=unclassified Castellaniella TaxID=2617606 RepID=UPI003314CCDD
MMNLDEKDNGLGFLLKCPVCGGGNFHHGLVEVFTRRGREDVAPTRISINPDGTVQRDDDNLAENARDNPSPRRDGVLVHLDPECGCGRFVLQIVQHKGSTYLRVGQLTRSIKWFD